MDAETEYFRIGADELLLKRSFYCSLSRSVVPSLNIRSYIIHAT